MNIWYKGEPFRLFPNIEISESEEDGMYYVSLCWMKMVLSFKIGI